jgi:hypothetical protein
VKCSCIWPDQSEDTTLGHLNDTIHHCVWTVEIHPVADLMLIGAATQFATDQVKIHRCECGVSWIERTKMAKRIQ